MLRLGLGLLLCARQVIARSSDHVETSRYVVQSLATQQLICCVHVLNMVFLLLQHPDGIPFPNLMSCPYRRKKGQVSVASTGGEFIAGGSTCIRHNDTGFAGTRKRVYVLYTVFHSCISKVSLAVYRKSH